MEKIAQCQARTTAAPPVLTILAGVLTIQAGVQQMLSKVAAEHSFPQDPSLLQLLFAGSGLHEGPEECDELAVFPGHCTQSMKSTLVKKQTQLSPTDTDTDIVRMNGQHPHYGSVYKESMIPKLRSLHISLLG